MKPRRSDATRNAILAAARERFAADGYERATIRAIASQAEIDPAMVMRYFGSKERPARGRRAVRPGPAGSAQPPARGAGRDTRRALPHRVGERRDLRRAAPLLDDEHRRPQTA